MTLTGGLAGFWMFALLSLHSADLGDTQRNSLNEPDIPFPPAKPTAENLAAICYQGQGRPRYPASFFPRSGASHFRRRGDAINKLESWYSLCCSGQVAQESSHILCCAQQAWRQALSRFCVEEYSTMTNAYLCCKDKGDARWACFDRETPNPNYEPTPAVNSPQVPPDPAFTFNVHAC